MAERKIEDELQVMPASRYVIFSADKGVYLGPEMWSFGSENTSAPAPTYTRDEAFANIKELAEAGHTNLRSKLVWPDVVDARASPKACNDAGIPWERPGR